MCYMLLSPMYALRGWDQTGFGLDVQCFCDSEGIRGSAGAENLSLSALLISAL